jgi:hypothetical protein
MSAKQYRDELEDLLRRAEADGYQFNLEYEVEVDAYGAILFDADHFFMNRNDYTDHATVNGDLIWETEV